MEIPKDIPVLIVDDLGATRRVLKRMLETLEFSQVEEVAEGGEAIALIKSKDYGLVICDYHLEDMKGLQVLEELKNSSGKRKVPFVMITADVNRDELKEAAKLGLTSCLYKPFNEAQLMEEIRIAFEKAA